MMASAVIAVACGPTLQVRMDYDRSADFRKYLSFALEEGKVVSELGYGEERNTLVKDRIDSALQTQLAAKGLKQNPEAPDLVVKYVAGARTKQELEGTGYTGMGWYGPGYQDFWVNEYPEGTLVIDLIDAKTQQLVWRAYVKAEGEGLSDPAFIQKSVAKALEKYPPVKERAA